MRPPLSSARSYWVITSAEKGAFFTLEGFAAGDGSSPGGLLATAPARPVSRTRISLVTAHLSLMLPSIRLTSPCSPLADVSVCLTRGQMRPRAHLTFSFRTKGKTCAPSHALLAWALGGSTFFYSVLSFAVMQLKKDHG